MSPRRKLPRFVLACLAAASVVLSACGGSDGKSDVYQYDGATKIGTLIPAQQRKPAIDVDGTLVTSANKTSLDERKGTVTVVAFWASWCGPCRVEMPLLQNVQTQYGSKVDVLGVNFKDDRDSAKSFLSSFGITFPNVYDQPGRNVIKLGNSPAGPPFTMLVDKSGKVAAFYAGRYAEKDLTRALDTLRAET